MDARKPEGEGTVHTTSTAVTAEQLLRSKSKRKKLKSTEKTISRKTPHYASLEKLGLQGIKREPWHHRLIDVTREFAGVYYEYKVEDVKDEVPKIIRWLHHCDTYTQWILLTFCFVQFFLITYVSVFAFFLPEWFRVVYVIDLLFMIDTAIRISIEFWRHYYNIPYLVLFSPYTLSTFLIDVVSLIPIERIVVLFKELESLNFIAQFDFFRYNRILRFYRIFTFLSQAENERIISERTHFMVKYYIIYLGFVQFVACSYEQFLGVSTVDILLQHDRDLKRTWLGDIHYKKPVFQYKEWDFFTLSFYFALSVVTTTGFGDMEAANVGEMTFSIFVMLIGAIVFPGLFTSGLTNFELKVDGARYDLFYRVDAIINYVTELGTHAIFQNKIKEFYPLLWNFREGVLDVPFFNDLPRSMREDIKFDFCQEMFHKSYLFRGIEESFLRAVAAKCDVVLFNPEMILCSSGTYAMQMYFLIQGELLAESKHKILESFCVVRSGCLIGELNLFFSYPYSTNLCTRTCCQMLKIEKEDLYNVLESYPLILETLRSRIQRRLKDLDEFHSEEGESPFSWIQAKETLGFAVDGHIPANDYPVLMRSGNGFNRLVLEDIYNDSRERYIIEMPCIDKRYERRHTLMYENCLVPSVLTPYTKWVGWWTSAVLLVSLVFGFLEPYCFAFNIAGGFTSLLCNISWHYVTNWVMFYFYVFDVFVEVTYAVPAYGIYYKLIDGFHVVLHKPGFWLGFLGFTDMIAAFPLFLFSTPGNAYYFNLATVVIRCLKLWKVKRYFNYLDNRDPGYLFYYRLIQTVVVLLYSTHFLACIYYLIACPAATRKHPPICQENTWLASYQLRDRTKENIDYRYLGSSSPYLLSFYFASATLSSTGFGDFNPQNHAEVYATSAFELISFFILCYYTAILTSALSCIVRPKLAFQKRLLTVNQFMVHYGIDQTIQKRVIEHHRLQYQLWQGVLLPEDVNTLLFDTPKNFHDDALYLEVEALFNGVPLLEKIDPKLVVKIAKDIKKYLIPPGVVFLRKSEVRRQMYLLGKGSVGVYSSTDMETPVRILEPTSYFSIRDLMFGQPAHHNIKTLSYCLIYEIELSDLNILMKKDLRLEKLLSRCKDRMKDHIDAMVVEYSLHSTNIIEGTRTNKSWYYMPSSKKPVPICTIEEYEAIFQQTRFGWFYRIVLMNCTINPSGTFAKTWTVLQSLNSYLIIITLITEAFMSVRLVEFRFFQYCLDIVNIMDIYVKLHWAYYDDDKHIIISHPLLTAIRYLFDGSFILDITLCFPYELLLYFVGISDIFGLEYGVYWYTKVRFVRMGQALRLPFVIKIMHNLFRHRTTLLTIMYMLLTLWMCTILSAIACNIACPVGESLWDKSFLYYLPACKKNTWALTKGGQPMKNYWQRWVFGCYYVCQVLLLIGFGDMITLNNEETLLLVFMMLFGFVIIRCILADITSAQVEFDEIRVEYSERMQRLKKILYRERAPESLINSVMAHLTHTWDMEKGLQPWKLLSELHPSLQADVFKNFVGEALKKVPLFRSLTENVLRNMCQHLDKEFFQPGEVIKRYGNLAPEMYIILDGKVWVTLPDFRWVCTLRRGESFGDASLVLGSRNMYNIIAASHVEVFSITAEGLRSLLDKYPEVCDELSRKLAKNKSQDLFEIHMKRRVLKSKLAKAQNRKIKEFYRCRTGYTDEFVTIEPKSKTNFWTRNIASYGPELPCLPFIYFLSKEKDERKFQFLIHPKCNFVLYYNEIRNMIWGFSPAFAIYDVCFTSGDNTSILINVPLIYRTILVLEALIVIRMMLEFFVPIKLFNKRYSYSHKAIALRYFTRLWNSFWTDAIATIPTYLLGDTESYRLLALLRCVRWLQFLKFNDRAKDAITSNIVRKQVMITVFIFVIMSHILACVFYIISPCKCVECPISEVCGRNTWTSFFVSDHNFAEKDKKLVTESWRWYIRSVYWVITTVSTTGFGGITPRNVPESLLGIVCIFAGSFALSIILSQFTSGISTLTRSKREYSFQANIVTKYYTNIGMSTKRGKVLTAYYASLWDNCTGLPYHKSYDFLPLALKHDVCCGLYSDVLSCCELFQPSSDSSFIRQLCGRVEHAYFLPGTNIATEGDAGDRLYIVYRGTVVGYNIENDQVAIKGVYVSSEEFGKLPGFFLHANYTKTYRAETHVEVLSICQKDMLILASYFPAYSNHVQIFLRTNYKDVTGLVNIFKQNRDIDLDISTKKSAENFANQPTYTKKIEKEKATVLKARRQKQEGLDKRSRLEKPTGKILETMKKKFNDKTTKELEKQGQDQKQKKGLQKSGIRSLISTKLVGLEKKPSTSKRRMALVTFADTNQDEAQEIFSRKSTKQIRRESNSDQIPKKPKKRLGLDKNIKQELSKEEENFGRKPSQQPRMESNKDRNATSKLKTRQKNTSKKESKNYPIEEIPLTVRRTINIKSNKSTVGKTNGQIMKPKLIKRKATITTEPKNQNSKDLGEVGSGP